MISLKNMLSAPGCFTIAGAPSGFDALVLADAVRLGDVVFVARDDARMARMAGALAFFAPDVECLEFPAWDCLPYDRVSPNADTVARRIDTLTRLMDAKTDRPRVVLTTVSAFGQRVPPRTAFEGVTKRLALGDRIGPGKLTGFLEARGYGRSDTVMEQGEYAVRGGLIDVFPPGAASPVRLDFFGDELDGIRTFDPSSQRTTGKAENAVLKPVSEVPLDADSVSLFRSRYREMFGAVGANDPLYEAVSAGRRHIGVEHWLPLFFEGLETLLDYVGSRSAVVLDHQATEAREARLDLIAEYFAARKNVAQTEYSGPPYHPISPETLFLSENEWETSLQSRSVGILFPFAVPEGKGGAIEMNGRPGRDFADARVQPGVNVFEVLKEFLAAELAAGRRLVIAALSRGSAERLAHVLAEHGVEATARADDWAAVSALPENTVALAVLYLERGFSAPGLTVIGEQDILGERLIRPSRKIKPENFIAEASSLGEGDLVVHVEHGIGRYEGLEAIEVAGAPHDCLRLAYGGGARLYLPVENIEVISRYGSDAAGAQLDRLGGAAWQARKSKLKERIREMACELISTAAARQLKPAQRMVPPDGLFDEFCARFPYTETEDQRCAIDDTIADLASGRPSDRLVCGDVGFGKTEVALRAAFAVVMTGRQVVVVVPTTLLARQHHQTFVERFRDLPVKVEQLSRLVTGKTAKAVKQGLKSGTVDVVIGTHALLAKDVAFRDLGLLVVDEEQHFGVAHKEKLKKLKSDVHVLTLSATPIPRTLQMALAGVKEMSIIASPPVDRLAVRTFVLPFDPVVVREAILRERYRGGQTFYVCPRIEDLDGVEARLKDLVPEIRMVTVHGRMAAKDLEERISAFFDRKFDVLLSTNIIESGLDMPAVNTMVIHRADMFGLSQLYQLRGRVGRSKIRAYAYLTLPQRQKLSKAAEKRLEVMQTLDTLGAGFSLASYDLDIRGAGNLLGDEQSGHIREVGIELYQKMLEEAVAEVRGAGQGEAMREDWSPQIAIGMSVLIPDGYVADLNVRMELYRRIARLADQGEIDSFAAEMIDRFGSLPTEVENLLRVVAIKQLCKRAGIDKVEAGPKGAVVSFRDNQFANPVGLVTFITEQVGTAKLRPDHKLVYKRGWDAAAQRLGGVQRLMENLAQIAVSGTA